MNRSQLLSLYTSRCRDLEDYRREWREAQAQTVNPMLTNGERIALNNQIINLNRTIISIENEITVLEDELAKPENQ